MNLINNLTYIVHPGFDDGEYPEFEDNLYLKMKLAINSAKNGVVEIFSLVNPTISVESYEELEAIRFCWMLDQLFHHYYIFIKGSGKDKKEFKNSLVAKLGHSQEVLEYAEKLLTDEFSRNQSLKLLPEKFVKDHLYKKFVIFLTELMNQFKGKDPYKIKSFKTLGPLKSPFYMNFARRGRIIDMFNNTFGDNGFLQLEYKGRDSIGFLQRDSQRNLKDPFFTKLTLEDQEYLKRLFKDFDDNIINLNSDRISAFLKRLGLEIGPNTNHLIGGEYINMCCKGWQTVLTKDLLLPGSFKIDPSLGVVNKRFM